MEIRPYHRKAHYYETDQMGIIHHSNYIRWFEEARVDFMDQMGYSYQRLEKEGISSPLLSVACEYHSPVRFHDEIIITAFIREFTGVRMTVAYHITDAQNGQLRTTGETKHCFTRTDGRPVSLKRALPSCYALFCAQVEAGESVKTGIKKEGQG